MRCRGGIRILDQDSVEGSYSCIVACYGSQSQIKIRLVVQVADGVPLPTPCPTSATEVAVHPTAGFEMGKPQKQKSSSKDDGPSRDTRIAVEGGIRNKIIRSQLVSKRQRQERKEKSQRRRKRQKLEQSGAVDDLPAPKAPKTIESERIFDDETGRPLTREEALSITDEFTETLAGNKRPEVVITTGLKASPVSYDFVKALLPVVPRSVYYERKQASIDSFCKAAAAKQFTDLVIIKEDKKKLSTLTHVHLPEGPTAIYKISSFEPSERIRQHGRLTGHTPEVILNNFTTKLGLRVGRMLGSLFPHTPNFIGRQAVTFHNQRDFIFFRFHRYVFASTRDKARLQELGPRFTLKLRCLQKGTFQDPEKADNEFKWKTKTDINRRRFFL